MGPIDYIIRHIDILDRNAEETARRVAEFDGIRDKLNDRIGDLELEVAILKMDAAAVPPIGAVVDAEVWNMVDDAAFDFTRFAFWCYPTDTDKAYCYGGDVSIHGADTPTMTVAAKELTLASSVCWATVRHEWKTTTASVVIVGGATKPVSDNTFMQRALRKFTLDGSLYKTDSADIRHVGDVDETCPI